MQTVVFPDGRTMPMVGYGTYFGLQKDFTEDEVVKAVAMAIGLGYRHIDTARIYGTEQAVGKAIRQKIADGTVTREELFVTSKLSNAHHDNVQEGIRATLDSLKLDYLDLYLIHMPMALQMPQDGALRAVLDDSTKLNNTNDHVRTWKAMEQLVRDGLVRSIGVSNFNSKQVQNILDHCTIKPANNQVEIHVYLGNDKLVEYCQKRGVTITAYTPLGQPHDSWRPEGFVPPLDNPVLVSIAEAHKRSAGQVALRYQIQRGIALVAKSGNSKRLKQNIEIFDFTLSEEEMGKIRALDRNQRANWFLPLKDHKDYFMNEPF